MVYEGELIVQVERAFQEPLGSEERVGELMQLSNMVARAIYEAQKAARDREDIDAA